jgi:hypothetical protein
MARAQIPPPGRLVVSYIYSSVDALAESLRKLERHFGRVQFETVDLPYADRERYIEEMGTRLRRRFFSFSGPAPRNTLPSIKKTCARVEKLYSDHVGGHHFRTVNIDPGILTPDNLVMASYHEYNHRIYLGEGVFAETPLIWARGQYVRLPWTHLDFCHPEAVDFFCRVRGTFDFVSEDTEILAG